MKLPEPIEAWVLTRGDLQNLLEQVRNSSEVVFDLETTGLDENAVTGGRSNGGVGARVSLGTLTLPQALDGQWDGNTPVTYIVPLSHPRSPFRGEWRKVLRLLARAFVKYESRLIGHHVKFDARWVKAMTGIDVSSLILWDTQMGLHLLDENRRTTALKPSMEEIFDIERWDSFDLSYPGAAEEVEFWELGEYAAKDTHYTFWLYRYQIDQMFLTPGDSPMNAEDVSLARIGTVATEVSMPTARSLAKMEQTGIRLDVDYTSKHLKEDAQTSQRALDWLAQEYDLPREGASTASTSKWFTSLTEKAMERGELKLMAMTPRGNPKWDKHVIRKQARGGSKTAAKILEERDSKKSAEFLRSWLDKVTPAGTIHSTYRAATVRTGRLSSSDPNMQQVSKKLRPAFIPRPGHLIADLDYSQLELRITAYISRSEPMLTAYQEGQDLHSLLAADILTRRGRQTDPQAPQVAVEEVSPSWRQAAKAANFGLIYGQGVVGFRSYADAVYNVEFSEEEAQEIYDGFFQTWEGITEWHERTKAQVARQGYITSPNGRRRLLPNIMSGNEYLRSEAERQALNAPVQGFGSDLMQMALASIYGELPGSEPVKGAVPIATVHDSLVAEVPEDDWETVVEECRDRMENLDAYLARLGVELDVPLVAEASVGTRWGWSDISNPD